MRGNQYETKHSPAATRSQYTAVAAHDYPINCVQSGQLGQGHLHFWTICMQWSDLLSHERQLEWFRTALSQGRLASSFLFVGPDGIGKRCFALLLAKSLLCRQTTPDTLAPCNACEDCAQVDASSHPDLIQISKPADKAFLPIELLIGEREKRMREGLCHDISLRPYGGRRKIAIVDDADYLNLEGANSLLKTLEEPPQNSLIILVSSSLQRQLPTIRSRCQAIIFEPLQTEHLTELILRNRLAESDENAREIAHQAVGSLTEASLLADPDFREFRSTLLALLAERKLPCSELAKLCASLADAAGKDARIKRDRLKLVFRTSAIMYRSIAIATSSIEERENSGEDKTLARCVEQSLAHWQGGTRAATDCWNRCLNAIEQVDRNANQTALLEAWTTDLARLSGS